VNWTIPTKGAGVMWWFPHPMGVWDYVIMVINMVLFWGLIVLGLVGLFHYLASEIDEHQHHQRLKALRRTSRPHVKASDHSRRAA
jgi:hypothetical protein